MVQNTGDKVNEEVPNTEVVVKAKRKHFTGAEKQRILREVEACRGTGEIGALLRREGIYSSYLTTWKRQRENRELDGLAPNTEEHSAGKPDRSRTRKQSSWPSCGAKMPACRSACAKQN